MNDLEWSATLRFGPYARAGLATSPMVYVVAAVFGTGVALVFSDAFFDALFFDGWGFVTTAVFAVAVAALFFALLLVALARKLAVIRRAAGATVQRYTLGWESLTIRLGRDSCTLPLSELVLRRTGRDFLVVQRRTTKTMRMALFFDSPELVAVVAERIRAAAAAVPRT